MLVMQDVLTNEKEKKDYILNNAEICRSYIELCKAIKTPYSRLIPIIKRLGIIEDVKQRFCNRRLTNYKFRTDKYTTEKMIVLATECNSLHDMGKSLNITRERVRQVINLLGIKKLILSTLKGNRSNGST